MNSLFKYFILFSFINCNNLQNEQISLRYYLVSVDSKENMSLGYSINDDNSSFVDVVGETVFSVGFDDKYIIVKQHPYNNRNVTNYFIVPIYKSFNYSPDTGVIGALTYEKFMMARKELKISNDLNFTREIENLK